MIVQHRFSAEEGAGRLRLVLFQTGELVRRGAIADNLENHDAKAAARVRRSERQGRFLVAVDVANIIYGLLVEERKL